MRHDIHRQLTQVAGDVRVGVLGWVNEPVTQVLRYPPSRGDWLWVGKLERRVVTLNPLPFIDDALDLSVCIDSRKKSAGNSSSAKCSRHDVEAGR